MPSENDILVGRLDYTIARTAIRVFVRDASMDFRKLLRSVFD